MTKALDTLHETVMRTHSTVLFGVPKASEGGNLTHMRTCATLGLAEEVAEVIGPFKKHIEQGRDLDCEKIKTELGDLLYYCQLTALSFGFTLEDSISAVHAKLAKRFPNGFNTEDALNRVDVLLDP